MTAVVPLFSRKVQPGITMNCHMARPREEDDAAWLEWLTVLATMGVQIRSTSSNETLLWQRGTDSKVKLSS